MITFYFHTLQPHFSLSELVLKNRRVNTSEIFISGIDLSFVILM